MLFFLLNTVASHSVSARRHDWFWSWPHISKAQSGAPQYKETRCLRHVLVLVQEPVIECFFIEFLLVQHVESRIELHDGKTTGMTYCI